MMLLSGFAYCGQRTFLLVAAFIMALGQVFAAVEYAHQGRALEERTRRFFASLGQARVFIDARESWRQQRVTDSFARQKFVDAIGESGSLAIFAVYVILYLDLSYHPWLILSVLRSVIGLACGIVVWLDFSFNQQLADEPLAPGAFRISWHHHCVWLCYLASDFGLRLLSMGLFLASARHRPYSASIVVMLILAYLLAVATQLQAYEAEGKETATCRVADGRWIQVRRQVVAQRVVDGLLLTWLVHVLPADLRLAPRHMAESRQLFALHPQVRARITRVLVPLRAADFLSLGIAAMFAHFDKWQCVALVGMFLSTHILLGQVCLLRGPDFTRSPTHVELPNEIIPVVVAGDSQTGRL